MLFQNQMSTAQPVNARTYRFNVAVIRGKGASLRFRVVDHKTPLAIVDGTPRQKLIFVTRVLSNAEMRSFEARVDGIIRDIQRGVPESVTEDAIRALVANWGGTPATYAADGTIAAPAVPGAMALAEVQEEYRKPSERSTSEPRTATTAADINADLAG